MDNGNIGTQVKVCEEREIYQYGVRSVSMYEMDWQSRIVNKARK